MIFNYTEEQLAAIAEIEAVLNKHADVLALGMETPMLGDWAMVISWADMMDGNNHMVRFAAPPMLKHHLTGIFTEAAKDDWG